MGFLPLDRQASTPAYRQAGLPAVGGANAQNDRRGLLWMEFFVSLRMTTFFSVILNAVKDPSAFKEYTTITALRGILRFAQNDSQVNVRFFPARRRRGFAQNDTLIDVILRASARRIPCKLISDYHYCAWDSSLTLRMTPPFCHPERSLPAVGG